MILDGGQRVDGRAGAVKGDPIPDRALLGDEPYFTRSVRFAR
jgi:hypothetical protein